MWLRLAILIGICFMLFSRKVIRDVFVTMAYAMRQFEGWKPDSRSERNNNPGNLKFAGQPGAIGQDETGHAIFDSYESGWKALLTQIMIAFTGESKIYSPENTLYEFFAKYSQRNQKAYAEYVAQRLGVSPQTKLKDLIA